MATYHFPALNRRSLNVLSSSVDFYNAIMGYLGITPEMHAMLMTVSLVHILSFLHHCTGRRWVSVVRSPRHDQEARYTIWIVKSRSATRIHRELCIAGKLQLKPV